MLFGFYCYSSQIMKSSTRFPKQVDTLEFKDRDFMLRPAVTSFQTPDLCGLEFDVNVDVGHDLVRTFNHDPLRQIEPKW